MRFKPLTELKDYPSQYLLIRHICPVANRVKYQQYWFNSTAQTLLVDDDSGRDSVDLSLFIERSPTSEFAQV